MATTSLSIQTFIDSLPDDQRPTIPNSRRLTQQFLEERGLLSLFQEWKRRQYSRLHASRRNDDQRERERINQATSRALRSGVAQNASEALALVNPRWTTRPGPTPRKATWYEDQKRYKDLRQEVLDKLDRTSFQATVLELFNGDRVLYLVLFSAVVGIGMGKVHRITETQCCTPY